MTPELRKRVIAMRAVTWQRTLPMPAGWCSTAEVAPLLDAHHYLGRASRGFAWRDDFGVLVFSKPTSRRLPEQWLDLVRWCIVSREPNAGSRQWANVRRALQLEHADVTTIVSYSDPARGHTGALYRACNWWWAPTWHRLRPPPSGQGSWDGVVQQAPKDRWVFPLRRDENRVAMLTAQDESVLQRMPWARYREPGGADFKRFIGGAA